VASSSLSQSAQSTEYVLVAVSARENGALIDPTSDTVQMAFPVHGVAPVSGDFKSASWETDATVTPAVHYARCLVGPGVGAAVALTVGDYEVWVRIVDTPEVPVRRAGRLHVGP
jgi:hypothetical protein